MAKARVALERIKSFATIQGSFLLGWMFGCFYGAMIAVSMLGGS